MRLSPLAAAMLVGLALFAAACGGSEETTTKLNLSGLGSGSSRAFVDCAASEGCADAVEECKNSMDCLGACAESGECSAFARLVGFGGKIYGCAGLRYSPSQSPAIEPDGATTTETATNSTETDTGQETDTESEGETTTTDGETTTPDTIVPVDCTGPSIEISGLDLNAVAGQLQHSDDGALRWTDAAVRLGGTLQDGAFRVTTVEP